MTDVSFQSYFTLNEYNVKIYVWIFPEWKNTM